MALPVFGSAASVMIWRRAGPRTPKSSPKPRWKTIVAFGGGVLVTWPILSAIAGTTDPVVAFLLLLGALLFQSCYSSISAVVKAELYPTHVRALGVALPYAVANAVFGGSAEYAALAFKQARIESGFYVYVTVVMVLGLLVSIFLRDTKTHSQILED